MTNGIALVLVLLSLTCAAPLAMADDPTSSPTTVQVPVTTTSDTTCVVLYPNDTPPVAVEDC